MKTLILTGLTLIGLQSQAQTIVGSWQLTHEKTCFEAEMKKSETEKELEKSMGSSRNGVGRVIKFSKKGTGEDGVYSVGKKKAAGMAEFNYKINGNELLLLDLKSGIMTQHLIIDTLTQSTLKVHNAAKDCEVKTFSRIK